MKYKTQQRSPMAVFDLREECRHLSTTVSDHCVLIKCVYSTCPSKKSKNAQPSYLGPIWALKTGCLERNKKQNPFDANPSFGPVLSFNGSIISIDFSLRLQIPPCLLRAACRHPHMDIGHHQDTCKVYRIAGVDRGRFRAF